MKNHSVNLKNQVIPALYLLSEHMKISPCIVTVIPILFLVLITQGSAYRTISAYRGYTINLRGYSYGCPQVYLFVTGPNLPINSVALHEINAHADERYFTVVDVDSNDHWEYPWATIEAGGHLDAGTYTIGVVNRPHDRFRLFQAEYTTISIILRTPTITVDTPVIPGTLKSILHQPDLQ